MSTEGRGRSGSQSFPGASSAGEQASTCPSHRDRPGAAEEYVSALLRRYVGLPGTPDRIRAADARCARELFRREVPLAIAEAALVVGSARRTLRSPERPSLSPIRALHYFLPVIDELLEQPPEPDYVAYLARRLQAVTSPNRSP